MNVQSSAWAGGPVEIGTLSSGSVAGTTTTGASRCAACGATTSGALPEGATSTDTGTGLSVDISQQEVAGGVAWSAVPESRAFIIGQCGPQCLDIANAL